MNTNIRLVNSGFSVIDRRWGGIYRGGSYLIIGPRKSGRTLLGLQFAQQAALAKETCLYFTTMRPKDLMIQASSINFDLQTYMNKNSIIVVRVSPPNDAYDSGNPDDHLIEYINDILTVVNQYKPSRIIFDELTYYIGFRSLSLLKDVFIHTLEVIEERDITSVFILGEPATPKAQDIVDTITECVTGIIHLKKSNVKIDELYHGGTVVISPNVGHPEGRFSEEYIIKPYEGILTVDEGINQMDTMPYVEPVKSFNPEPVRIPEKREAETIQSHDSMLLSNLYEQNDFSLVLNNQIALYRSTGQTFNLLTFKLDPAAQVKGLLSMIQLQNAIKTAADKKDKICIIDNKIMILVINSNRNSILNLISRIESYLPSRDEGYLSTIKKFISVLDLEVNENYENADAMLNISKETNINYSDFFKTMTEFSN